MADINSLVNAVQSGNAVVSGYHSSGRNISWGTINDPTTGEAVGRLYHNAGTGDTFATPALGDTGEYRINNLSFDPSTGAVGKITDPSQVYFQNPEQSNDFLSKVLSSPATQIATAYFLPSVGAELGTLLGVGNAAGTALATIAVQTSQGVDFDTAVKNATVNAIINSGSPEVAKEINAKLQDPAVSNALTSVGASIVKTGALGGSVDDMIKNAGAALAGSAATTATTGPDVSPETSRAVGAAVGGALTGGVMGAATGAAGAYGQPTPEPTPEAPTPPAPTNVSSIAPTEVVVAPDIQVAGGESLPELPQPKQGQLLVDKLGRPITIGVIEFGSDGVGRLVAAPVTGSAETGYSYQVSGEPQSLTQSQYERLFYKTNPSEYLRMAQEVYGKTGNIDAINEALSKGRNYLSSMGESVPTVEGQVREVPTPETEFANKYPELAKLLKTYGSLDVAETAIGLDALMKIPGVMEAMNANYIKELEAGLAKDPTYAPFLEEYKKLTGKDYSPTAPYIPSSDLGTVEIVGEKFKDATQPFTPSVIAPDSSLVINVDSKTGKALVMDSTGKVTVVDAGADIKKDQYVTVDPATQTATATKTYPTVIAGTSTAVAPGSETLVKGQTKTDVAISDQPQTKTQTVTKPTGENVYGGVGSGGGGGPAAPITPEPFAGGITDKPSTTDKPVDKTDTTKELPPVEDRTGKSTYIPELLIYSGKYPGGLGRALGVEGSTTPTPTTGLTSYRGAGEIEVGPGIERQNVWNEASLRLKDALGV